MASPNFSCAYFVCLLCRHHLGIRWCHSGAGRTEWGLLQRQHTHHAAFARQPHCKSTPPRSSQLAALVHSPGFTGSIRCCVALRGWRFYHAKFPVVSNESCLDWGGDPRDIACTVCGLSLPPATRAVSLSDSVEACLATHTCCSCGIARAASNRHSTMPSRSWTH